MKKKKPKISAIDLFCGAGGLTHGLILEGIKVRAGIDIDIACQYPFEHNNKGAKFLEKSVKEISGEELSAYYKKDDIRVLAGCAPCQPFSTFRHAYEKKKKKELSESKAPIERIDEKWDLLKSFMRLVKELDPDIVTMENVPQLCRHQIFKDFVNFLTENKYTVTHQIVNCAKYGIPQRRKRLVLLASKKGEIKFPDAGLFEHTSVKQTIEHLPEITAGSQCSEDPLHKARNLSPINLRRIKASKAGGTWKDWSVELLPTCYTKETGETFKAVYGRMSWNDPSPVITTQFHNYGTGRFGHPEQDRAISLREAALLQTFPASYSFVPDGDPILINRLGRLIGNAVPPGLARIIGQAIREHVNANYEKE